MAPVAAPAPREPAAGDETLALLGALSRGEIDVDEAERRIAAAGHGRGGSLDG